MSLAYFDPVGGASGDMIAGALLDAGVDGQWLESELEKLGLHDEFSISYQKIVTRLIAATNFDVHLKHAHHHHHGHEHDHDHHHGRGFGGIRKMIEESDLKDSVKVNAVRIFRALGESEAKVHGTTLEKIHFHEVGAVDSIVDIVSVCLCWDFLGITEAFVAPLPLSHGIIHCQHGEWPVPGPATTDLLKGFEWRRVDIEGELVTPTAAAIFSALAAVAPVGLSAAFERVGYGAGKKDFGIPNVLRVSVGALQDSSLKNERLCVLETNIDDMSPELYQPVVRHLFNNGALDVWLSPVQMKKGRPGTLLSVLCQPSEESLLSLLILKETTSIGIRSYFVKRTSLPREVVSVHTPYGDIRVKVAKLPDGGTKYAPEYDDVSEASETTHASFNDIYLAAISAARQ